MTEEERTANRAAYRAANREILRQKQRAYYAANKERETARAADYRAANPEKSRAASAAYKFKSRLLGRQLHVIVALEQLCAVARRGP